MNKRYVHVWSAVGLVWLVGCSGGTPDTSDSRQSTAQAAGGKKSTSKATGGNGAGPSSDAPTISGGNGAFNPSSTTPAAGGSNGIDGSSDGGTGSIDGDPNGTTYDPPPIKGGTGNTEDPPAGGTGTTEDPPPNRGGAGNTQDPPPAGGAGTTDDPPKGGNTAAGGAGTTDDPPKGGKTGAGGSSTTDDTPPSGGTLGAGGTSAAGGVPAMGGSDAAGGVPASGGASSTGGASSVGGSKNVPECVISQIESVNVVVLKDAAPSNADVEGQIWIGGNATFQSWGYSANSTGTPELQLTCAQYGAVIGGDLNGTLILGSGSAAYGGALNGAFYSNANPQCSIAQSSPVDFVALRVTLEDYSATLRDYPTNGGVSAGVGALELTGTDPTLNVFAVSAADLAAATEVRFAVPESSSVVVNVSGTTVSWQNTGFRMPDGGAACRGGSSTWCHRILYNFYEAEALSLSSIGVQGSVLAPYATVDGGNGNIDGQLVCEYLLGGLEYHPYFFTGCLQLPKI